MAASQTVHVAGRYNKYQRNLSQSPWIDKDDVRIRNSVQELIEDGLNKFLKFNKSVFVSSGREDVDVRMLGKGRPFTFRLSAASSEFEPQVFANQFNEDTLKQVENYINSKNSGKIKVRDLQVVSKEDVSKQLKEGQESKAKEYRALCCCSRDLTDRDFELINQLGQIELEQATPIRVLHRRTLATRKRTIHKLGAQRLDCSPGDADWPSLVPAENASRVFALTLLSEAGTYIKEFVHGDFGRTRPNLSSILNGGGGGAACETDLMELDVMEVYLDWPPSKPDEPIAAAAAAEVAAVGAT